MENIIYSHSGNVSIRINEDKMSAWMYLHKSDKIIDEKEILDLIDESSIVNGFDEALQWMSANGYNKEFEKPFPVAICKSALNKEKLDTYFNKDHSYNPDIDWDLKDVVGWTLVDKGTALAEVSYNLFNDNGSIYNIFGELTTPTVNVAFISSYLGKNVVLDPDKKRILAGVTGYPYIDEDNKINVCDNLVYKGDLKFAKITSSLAASLTVEGSVNRAQLSVLKDLTVKGDILVSEVYTDGLLTVEGDITDCQTTGVIVMGDLLVNSISNSMVLCKGKLNFDTSIQGSRVIAGKSVTGNPEISQIFGSQVLTTGSVDVANLGNVEGDEAEIEVTISPFDKERIIQLKKNLSILVENPNLNAGKINQYKLKLENLEQILSNDMNQYLNNPDNTARFVKVRNDLFKGVYIRILKKSYQIKVNQSNVELTEE